MRKALLLVAALSITASLGAGHAEPLASCTGVAGPQFRVPPASNGVCLSPTTFATTEPVTSVTLTIEPGDGYTGFIRAYVYSETVSGGFAVGGLFIGGQLVSGQPVRVYSLGPAANWRLKVDTKNVTPYQVPGSESGAYLFGDLGAGAFGASVSVTEPGAVE